MGWFSRRPPPVYLLAESLAADLLRRAQAQLEAGLGGDWYVLKNAVHALEAIATACRERRYPAARQAAARLAEYAPELAALFEILLDALATMEDSR